MDISEGWVDITAEGTDPCMKWPDNQADTQTDGWEG